MSAASPALVGISHGTSSPDGRSAVAGLMEAVAAALPEVTTVSGYVDVQQPDVANTLAVLDDAVRDDAVRDDAVRDEAVLDETVRGHASRNSQATAIIVPLLLSAGYHVHVDLHEAARDWTGSATLARTLGPDPRLAELQHERLIEVGLTADDVVILAAAGSSDAGAVSECRTAADLVAARVGRAVTIGFLSAASPTLAEAIATARSEHPSARIVVSSYLLAPGYFQSIVENAGADVATGPLLAAGRPTPHQLVEIVVHRYRAALHCTTAH